MLENLVHYSSLNEQGTRTLSSPNERGTGTYCSLNKQGLRVNAQQQQHRVNTFKVVHIGEILPLHLDVFFVKFTLNPEYRRVGLL